MHRKIWQFFLKFGQILAIEKHKKNLISALLNLNFSLLIYIASRKSTGCQKGKLKIRKRRGFEGFFEAPEVKQNKHHHTHVFRFQCV